MGVSLSKTGVVAAALLGVSIAAQSVNTLSALANKHWREASQDAPFTGIVAMTFLPSVSEKEQKCRTRTKNVVLTSFVRTSQTPLCENPLICQGF